MALPANQRVGRAPTNFEGGPTFVYINQEAEREHAMNWVKIQLRDNNSNNRYAVGAKILVNDQYLRFSQVGGQFVASAQHTDFTVGLGHNEMNKLVIYWPSGDIKPQTITFDKHLKNQSICIERSRGLTACER